MVKVYGPVNWCWGVSIEIRSRRVAPLLWSRSLGQNTCSSEWCHLAIMMKLVKMKLILVILREIGIKKVIRNNSLTALKRTSLYEKKKNRIVNRYWNEVSHFPSILYRFLSFILSVLLSNLGRWLTINLTSLADRFVLRCFLCQYYSFRRKKIEITCVWKWFCAVTPSAFF